MSIALDLFCFTVSLAMPCTHSLSVTMMVGGCGCPSSCRVVRMGHAVCPLMKRPPTLALAADAMTVFMIWLMTLIAQLIGGLLVALPMNMYPPTLERDFGSEQYDASLCMCRIISLALYRSVASG
jgi:hypothetical protein